MPSEKRQRQKAREQAARDARVAQERRAQQRRTWLTIGGLVLLVIVLAFLYSLRGSDDDGEAAGAGDPDVDMSDAPCPPADHSAEQRLSFPGPPPDCLEEGASYEAVFDTTAGEIRVELDTEVTPGTTNNFVFLARYGYYDGTELFRSNTGIEILQGGAPHTNSSSDPGPGYTIADEGGPFSYEPGDLVMARTPAPNSAGAQFFFSTGPGTSLLNAQGTYVVFGKATEGMDVLEAIMETHVDGPQAEEGAPDPVPVVNSVRIVQS